MVDQSFKAIGCAKDALVWSSGYILWASDKGAPMPTATKEDENQFSTLQHLSKTVVTFREMECQAHIRNPSKDVVAFSPPQVGL